ncbi:OLC1v1024513C1 [Oldenlandia corymbosa var. corymbosa]|uniref:OLC1v1024513C1 n=1 Tax=Oldenlandia corymbosa var. corymbosa TaxID=529605 RepID=A0AAV1C2N2_OLDCO|nr:OLC1v1024513C1 [Oldenlandia corymbosa var. corymbosa]
MARNVPYMLNLYHTSKYVIETGSINTFSNMPDDGLFVEERLSYEGLISKICMTLCWDPAHVKLHLSLIFDSPSGRHVKIKNDSHVEFMNRVDPMSCLDLYIDLEDITQEEREASLENVSFGGFPRGERASTSRNRDEEETPLFAQDDCGEELDSDYIAPSESEEDCDVSGESDFEESDDERYIAALKFTNPDTVVELEWKEGQEESKKQSTRISESQIGEIHSKQSTRISEIRIAKNPRCRGPLCPTQRDQLTSLRVEDGEVLNNICVSTEKFREKREDENLLDEELDKHLDDIINQTDVALTLGANDEMEVEDTQILVDEDPSLPSQ